MLNGRIISFHRRQLPVLRKAAVLFSYETVRFLCLVVILGVLACIAAMWYEPLG